MIQFCRNVTVQYEIEDTQVEVGNETRLLLKTRIMRQSCRKYSNLNMHG